MDINAKMYKLEAFCRAHKRPVLAVVIICGVLLTVVVWSALFTKAHSEEVEWGVPITWSSTETQASIRGTALVKAEVNGKRKVHFSYCVQSDLSRDYVFAGMGKPGKGLRNLSYSVAGDTGSCGIATGVSYDSAGAEVSMHAPFPSRPKEVWTGSVSFDLLVDADAFEAGGATLYVYFCHMGVFEPVGPAERCEFDLSKPDENN